MPPNTNDATRFLHRPPTGSTRSQSSSSASPCSIHGVGLVWLVVKDSNLASCPQLVLMDESAQAVVSTYPSRKATVMPVPTVRSSYHLWRKKSLGRRNLPGDSLVRAMPIVVAGVAAQDALEMGFVHDHQVVQALRSDGAHEALGEGVRVRSPKGRLEDLGALGLEHSVEAHVLGIPVADKEPGGDLCVGEVTGDVPGLLGDPSCIGVSGDPSDPDPPAAEIDEEQDVETPEQNGIDVEEIGGHDAGRLRAQELAPGGAAPSGGRSETVVLQNLSDGACGQAQAELAELTLD